MSTDVPPREMLIPPTLPISIGRIAITLKNIAPISVILDKIFEMKSEVDLPGRIPGIAPPFLRRLFAISIGLNWIVA